ncbi:MAG: 23S rRNA (guanosine(2251)-2'-O)-methyltransferase RlmB [Bosea sp. (in: a-proteobacteria)]
MNERSDRPRSFHGKPTQAGGGNGGGGKESGKSAGPRPGKPQRRFERAISSKAKRVEKASSMSLRNGPDDDSIVTLYGVHPVIEALKNPRRKPLRLLATENGANRLTEEVPGLGIAPMIVTAKEIEALLTPDAVHQGLYLEAEPLPSPDLGKLADDALVLVLDQVTDPHNVGAIMRSAAAFGVTAMVVTQRHSPATTGVLAKAASGALEHVPVVAVKNLGDALQKLADQGANIIGFDSDGAASLDAVIRARPLVLVMGAEGKGLRARTRELCSVVARLEMPGAIKSLNVSNATAVALYAVTRG